MTIHVPEILIKAAAKNERVSPVDIVMGEHWGEIDLGSSSRLSLLRHILNKQQSAGKGGGSGSNHSKLRIPLRIVSRSPQALVKVIRNGGTANARGMRDQMSYLEKDGDSKLERSERYFGAEIDAEEQEALIDAWGLSDESKTNSDKTTHFVVSFPADTDHDAAYRAGRAWAEEMFASGTYGDVFDYYTAFHTDKAHPHIHVVVNRRGMENGDWLKVSKRSQYNYDEFRAVQVEVASREGIYLEATPRLARAMTDRPIPDAEIRQAEREGRSPKAPSHTSVTALRAAASVLLYSQQMTADAQLLRDQHPELSSMISDLANGIREGRQVLPKDTQEKPILTMKEVKTQSEFIMSRRSEILSGIKEIDTEISTIPFGKERSQLEHDASRIKAEAAQYIPEAIELTAHSQENSNGYYKGIEAKDGVELEAKRQADVEVGKLAESVGIDPATFISRYDRPNPASAALSDQWRKDELEDIQQNLTYRQAKPADQYEKLAQTAYDDLHRNALQTYRKAERDLEAHALRKKELYRVAKLIREGRRLEDGVEDSFRKTVKQTLHSNELRELEAGHSKAFQHVTKDVDQQRALSRRYLEAEQQDADGVRKLQLSTALAKIDRDTQLVTERAAQTVSKDRGIDR